MMIMNKSTRASITAFGVIIMVFGLFGCKDARDDNDDNLSVRIDEMYKKYKVEKFPGTPDVSVDEAIKEKAGDENVVLLDVRSKEEQAVSVIPGAITQAAFEADEDKFKGKKVIVYCTVGYRSGLYTAKLREKSFDAYNLKGGVLGWAAGEHGFVEQGGKATKKVHVYGKQWNLLPKGYEGVW